jgi:glycosyltransferase involved in cell wall biosynthesis
VDIVLGNCSGPLAKELPCDARIVDLKQNRIRFAILPLRGYLKNERPDVLISFLDHANLAALLAGLTTTGKTKIAVTSHIYLSVALKRLGVFKHLGLSLLLRLLYRQADVIVAVSRSAALDLAKVTGLPAERIKVIFNPVIALHAPDEAQKPVTHPWLQNRDVPVILAVGRLTEQKNHEHLIRAFALVRKQFVARLVILGEGELRSQLQFLIHELKLEDTVDMPGYVADPLSYMSRVAVVALSSKWEALPTVLIEALSMGVPVVSTDCPSGPREILNNGQWGRLVPVGNVETLAQALLEVLSSVAPVLPSECWYPYRIDVATCKYLDALGIVPTQTGCKIRAAISESSV